MKKGMILYVTEGKEEMQQREWPNVEEPAIRLGVNAVRLATSEDEIAYGWWELLTRGIHQVSCMKANYDPVRDEIEPWGIPMRLCG